MSNIKQNPIFSYLKCPYLKCRILFDPRGIGLCHPEMSLTRRPSRLKKAGLEPEWRPKHDLPGKISLLS
jgi:hypothetical protein